MRAIWHFIKTGNTCSGRQIPVHLIRAALYVTIVMMWAYTWSMVPEQTWASLGLTWQIIVWYILIAEVPAFTGMTPYRVIEADFREGKFQTYFSRPYSWLPLFLAQECGYLPVNFVVIAAAGLLSGYAVTGEVPFDWVIGLQVVIHLAVAMFIWLCLLVCTGLTTLWVGSSNLAYWLIQKGGFILGGLLLPLSLYPQWLQDIAIFTPFVAVFYIPAQGILPDPVFGFIDGLLYQIFMLGVVLIFTTWFYSCFQKKILREG